jgi:hypothetical protein
MSANNRTANYKREELKHIGFRVTVGIPLVFNPNLFVFFIFFTVELKTSKDSRVGVSLKNFRSARELSKL